MCTNNIELNVDEQSHAQFLVPILFSLVYSSYCCLKFCVCREGLNEMYNVIRKQLDSEIQLRKVKRLVDWLQFLITLLLCQVFLYNVAD